MILFKVTIMEALPSGKGIRLNAMITGDCSQESDQNEWLGKE